MDREVCSYFLYEEVDAEFYTLDDSYEIINRTQAEGIIKDPKCLSVTKEDIIESYGGERLWPPSQ